MLGRYNGGAAYYRGIFLNLFNAPLIFNRDLKCEKTRLENPTFNMVMCGHPDEFGEFVRKEKSENPDGLSLRVLYNMPRPLLDVSFRTMKKMTKTVKRKTWKQLVHLGMNVILAQIWHILKILYCFHLDLKIPRL